MRKPFSVEKEGSAIEIKIYSLLLFLGLSADIYAQLPINGFCRYDSYDIPSGYSRLYSLNYNGDSYTDLLLYNSGSTEYFALPGDALGGFNTSISYKFPTAVNKIHRYLNDDKTTAGYAYINRREMTAGVFDISLSGKASIRQKKRFTSYPDNISSADTDSKGEEELLISGSNFQGLSLISFEIGGINESRVTGEGSYSAAIFIDINNDGFPDIAAHDVRQNALVFFYNNSRGQFRETRRIPLSRNISLLKAFDINLDSYEDLIYLSGNRIYIMYGDFASSYNKQEIIETAGTAADYILGDFNKDGRMDIALLYNNNSGMSLLLGRSEFEFYPEKLYIKKEGTTGIIPYYSKFITGILTISGKGKLYSVRNMVPAFEDVSITAGVQPGQIRFFDRHLNGINDISYIDEYDSTLNVILRNKEGIPELSYSYPLFGSRSSVLIDNSRPDVKVFYCFTRGRREIEALTVDFRSSKAKRAMLYLPGGIAEVKLKNNGGERNTIYASYINNGSLGLTVFDYKDFHYFSRNYPDINNNVTAASISFSGGVTLYYWKQEGGSKTLLKCNPLKPKQGSTAVYTSGAGSTSWGAMVSADILNNEKEAAVTFLRQSGRNKLIISGGEGITESRIVKDMFDFSRWHKSRVYYGEYRHNGLKKLFVYSPLTRGIYRADFIKGGGSVSFNKIAGDINAAGYFIKNMNFIDYHLVYTDSEEGCIKIKKI